MNTSKYETMALALLSCMLFLGSCKRVTGPEDQIPMDASAVVVVNTSSIFTKMALDQLGELSAESLFGGQGANRPPTDPNSDEARWRELIDNPEQLGVDLLEDVYLIAGEEKGKAPSYMAALFVLNNREQLEAYLNHKPPRPMSGDNQEGRGFTYRTIDKGEGIIAWNQTLVLYLKDRTNGGLDVVKEAGYILNLPSDKSMMERGPFRDFMKGSRDMGVFINPKPYQDKELWAKGLNAIYAQMKFRDGELQWKMSQYLEEGEQGFDWLGTVGAEESFSYVDLNEPIAFANLRYSSDAISQYLSSSPILRDMMENTLAGTNFSMNDLQQLFTGRALLACTGVAMLEKEVIEMEMDEEFNMIERAVIKEVPAPEFIIALPSKENNWQAVAQGLVQQGVLKEEGAGVFATSYPDPLGNSWRVHTQTLNGYALVVNTQDTPMPEYDMMAAESAFLLQNYPSALYVNFGRLVEVLPLTVLGSNKEVVAQTLEVLEVGIKQGSTSSEIQVEGWLKLQNKERNALPQLIELFRGIDSSKLSL